METREKRERRTFSKILRLSIFDNIISKRINRLRSSDIVFNVQG